MYSLRSFTLLFVILLSGLVASISANPAPKSHADPEKFQALLSTVGDWEIRDVLSKFDHRFREGVFQYDRTAIEAVHGEDPAMATELVKLAKNKRQASNSTITTSNPPATVAPPATSSAAPENTQASTTESSPDSPTATSAASPNAPSATSNSQIRTSVIPPSSPTSAMAVSTTSGAVVYSQSNGKLTTAHSSTARVSFRPSTTVRIITTTLPDGEAETLTSTAVVDAAYTTLPDTAVAAATGTDSPSLATGAAVSAKGCFSGALAALALVAVIAWTM